MDNGLQDLNQQKLLQLCKIYITNEINKITSIQQNQYENINENENGIDMKILKYDLKSISENPIGFLGIHQYLIVNISYKSSTDGNHREATIRFFVKSAPKGNISRMNYLTEFGVFHKEILCYRHILPKLERIFNKAVSAKYFYSDKDLIILEDLTQNGFKIAAKRDGLLDYDHMKCVVNNLATLHAASLIYEIQMHQPFDKIHYEAIKENAYPAYAFNETHVRYQNVAQAIKVIEAFIKYIPRYEKRLNVILEELPQKIWQIYEFVQTSRKYRNVFSHGDLWANNIMFQYDGDMNKPVQCRFVDFQLARYAPPIIDLITVLTIPTSRQFRKQYLNDLLQQYYKQLKVLLNHKNYQMDQILTEAEFYKSFEEFRMCGLIESILFSHLTILPGELSKNLTSTSDGFTEFFGQQRIEICLKAFHNDHIYRERLSDMLEDLIDTFILTMVND